MVNSDLNHVENLLQYDNVEIELVRVRQFFKGSFFEQKSIFKYPHKYKSEIAGAAKVLLVRKYGGIYMDLDIPVEKSLETLPFNSACAEYMQKLGK